MHAVGDLVGVDPDVGRLDAVDRRLELLGAQVPERVGERGHECGWSQRQNGSERPTTFSHSRLWLSCSPDEQPAASGVRSSDGLTPRS